jgi:hypothetical protein
MMRMTETPEEWSASLLAKPVKRRNASNRIVSLKGEQEIAMIPAMVEAMPCVAWFWRPSWVTVRPCRLAVRPERPPH